MASQGPPCPPCRSRRSRRSAVLVGVLAAAGIMLALAGCDVTPLGPTQARGPTSTVEATPVGSPQLVRLYTLASPIIVQVMRSQSPPATGACPVGQVEVSLPPGAAPMPCFRPVGTTVTLTTAGLSQVSTDQQAPAAGQPQPASYGFVVAVQAAQVAAVTALITQAYDSHAALGITVDGKLWEAPQVLQAFSGQQFQISLQSRNQAVQLYDLLVPPG
jgi:hypothetical protein